MQRWAVVSTVLVNLCLWIGLLGLMSPASSTISSPLSVPSVLSVGVSDLNIQIDGQEILPLDQGQLSDEFHDAQDPKMIPKLYSFFQEQGKNRVVIVEWSSSKFNMPLRYQIAHTAAWAGIKHLAWRERL
jgi:hypothetical protein